MRIDFGQKLIDFRTGEPLKDPDGEEATLASVAVSALLAPEQGQDGKEKFKLYELAKAISPGKVVTIDAEDVAKIKESIGKHYTAAAVGAAWNLLEGE